MMIIVIPVWIFMRMTISDMDLFLRLVLYLKHSVKYYASHQAYHIFWRKDNFRLLDLKSLTWYSKLMYLLSFKYVFSRHLRATWPPSLSTVLSLSSTLALASCFSRLSTPLCGPARSVLVSKLKHTYCQLKFYAQYIHHLLNY